MTCPVPHAPKHHRIAGMTLIEMLVSLALAVLTLMAAYAVYHAVMRVSSGHAKRVDGPAAAARALTAISRDLACSLTPAGIEDAAMILRQENPDQPHSYLSCYTAIRDPETADLTWFLIQQVRFRTVEDQTGTSSLVCERRNLRGPGSEDVFTTNVLVRDVHGFKAEVLANGQWLEQWPLDEAVPFPDAVRLQLAYAIDADIHTESTEVLIPAAMKITSSIERRQAASDETSDKGE